RLGGLERPRRVFVDLEEVGGTQIVVTDLVVGADARGVDGGLEMCLGGMLGVDVARGGDLGEVATDGHHAQVLGRELDLGVQRIELPIRHFSYLRRNSGATNRLETPFISSTSV